MRIHHFATSKSAGAGRAALRLHEAMNAFGVESHFYSRKNGLLVHSPHESDINLDFKNRVKSSFLTASQSKLLQKSPFPVTTYSSSVFSIFDEEYLNCDIVHIHAFYNLFSLNSLKSLERIDKPIFFTLHDQRLMTGGCHYALGCSGYKTNCAKCPQVHSIFRKSVSNSLLQSKSIAANGKIRLVTPSSWIREEAEKSHALKGLPIRNIFNPIPSSYAAVNRKEARLRLEISETVYLLGFSAAILHSPFKGMNDFIGALKILAEVSPIPFEILFIGNGMFDAQDIPFRFKQVSATSDDEIAQFLGALDLLVVPSIADNSPSIIGESQMAGTAVVGSRIGGIPELIDDERRLFEPNNSQDLARVILENIKSSNNKQIRNVAKERFSYEKIAAKFSDYYLESLK